MNQYALVAHTDITVYERIMEEKQLFFREYGERQAIQTRPHIPIAQFSASEAMEDTLIRWIQKICSQQQSFAVTLNNYSGIPKEAIYLRVQDYQPFQLLLQQFKSVDEYLQSSACPGMVFNKRPSINIVSNLTATVYEKAIMDYSQKTFHDTFMIQELLLLRKDPLIADCKTVNIFRFQPADKNLMSEVA